MEQLLLRLGSSATEPVSWLVWSSSENEVIASGELADATQLSSLSERAGDRPVVALVASCNIALKWVTLPPRAGRKVLAAIPFMLEEELAQDISKQFFALGPKSGDQQAVAIVSRDLLEAWLTWLNEAGLNCETIIPDVLAVPYFSEGWSVLNLGNDVIIRQDEWCGLQGEADWTLPAVAHYSQQQKSPLSIKNYSQYSLHELPNTEVASETVELPMLTLAKTASEVSFNLLQGDYKVKRQNHSAWKQWRVAAVLAVLVLTASGVEKGVKLAQLKQQNTELAKQIDDTVKQGFPNIGVYRDVRRKVQAEMAKLEAGSGNSSMLAMLGQLGTAFTQSQVKPQTLRFDANRAEIRMQAAGKNFEALEQFKKHAEQAGFEVESGAINNRGDEFVGTIAIRGES
ncbi:type II secretion system protein GspL [Alteromonas sp. ASW11-130]|uniref:type II secretion system protein GspL n=1 Tax=Alteromonas sp. ASW11-130 TaxID=3015775 RepID=UPI0022427AC8|nr:type II secretion system protein GspL [Alteromonas sp. ASW11-130]MCW8093276.1 type II secretion system protein GspL [Alteromonas sp. ASW11-130]